MPTIKSGLSCLVMAALLTTGTSSFAKTLPVVKFTSVSNPEEEKPAAKAKANKAFSSLNNKTTRIYPDAIKRDMHVVAKDNEGQSIDFFVFDLQGTLVEHYKMKPRDHYRIGGLARGTYIYRVFRGDVENAAGKFEIR